MVHSLLFISFFSTLMNFGSILMLFLFEFFCRFERLFFFLVTGIQPKLLTLYTIQCAVLFMQKSFQIKLWLAKIEWFVNDLLFWNGNNKNEANNNNNNKIECVYFLNGGDETRWEGRVTIENENFVFVCSNAKWKKNRIFFGKATFFSLLLAYNFIQLYGSFHIEWANTSTESVRKKRLHSKNLLPNTIKSPTVNNSEKRRLSTIMKLHKQSFWLNNVRQFP